MTDKPSAPAAIRATFENVKTIPSRRVCQVIFEVPIEQMLEVLTVFGSPDPNTTTWAALARLKDEKEIKQLPPPEENNNDTGNKLPERASAPLAQRIAILCQEVAFRKFLTEQYKTKVETSDQAASFIRGYCDVMSRSEIEHNSEASQKWEQIYSKYRAWLTSPL